MKTHCCVALLIASVSLFAGAEPPGWGAFNLSDALPDQPRFPSSRWDGCPSAGPSGVTWCAAGPSVPCAVAFWDGEFASYVVPRPEGWAGPLDLGAWNTAFVTSFSAFWPPDDDPRDAEYLYAEMFYFDGAEVHQITEDYTRYNAAPSLFSGQAVWQQRSAHALASDDWEIMYWDGLTVRQITDNDVDDTDPCLYGNTIAWCSGGDIVHLTLPVSQVPSLLLPPIRVAAGASPSLFGGKLAYHASDGEDMEIFLHDIETGATLQITDNEREDTNPCLYDGTLVWQSSPSERENADIFYWDGVTVHQLTNDPRYDDINPSLWGTGLNTTVAYKQAFYGIISGSRVVALRRDVVSIVSSANPGETTIAWPSLEGRAYRVEYSDDLVNWKVAADAVPSAGYGETSWTDGEGSGTTPPPSEVSQRFHRVCEGE